jgi:hypothetical protein
MSDLSLSFWLKYPAGVRGCETPGPRQEAQA